ncbi:MAG: prepilin peptidase [Patescibacteria group bacterium]
MVFWSLSGFIIGTVLGSLAKAVADRSLIKKSFWGRSSCPKCQHRLAWYDLLPILTYIFLKGECRYCHKKIGIQYLLVEVVTGILVAYLFIQSFENLRFSLPAGRLQSILNFQSSIFLFKLVLRTFFVTVLVSLFLTDIKKMLIPDRIVKPAIFIGVASLLAITIYKVGYLYYYLSQSVIGRKLLPPHSEYFYGHAFLTAQPFVGSILVGLAIGGFFWGLIIITRGKGMGGGDVKLGAFIGIMLGFPNALLALMLSFLIGAVFSLGLIVTGKKHFGQVIPFGPFLVLGSLIAIFWGNEILNWYLHLGY